MSLADCPVAPGDNVYVNHPDHAWVLGSVTAVAANPLFARAPKGKRVPRYHIDVDVRDKARGCPSGQVARAEEWNVEACDASLADRTVSDLLSLTHLHDATILRCLHLRYMQDVVYTDIGAIVVALNPFNFKIPHYQQDRVAQYLAEAGHYIPDKLLPHSWAQAHNTYQDMVASGGNQCILISGESGAGKTEATKIVMKYLSLVSALHCDATSKKAADTVLANLIACSPILEAFGNARTVRNDNSSRFGKLMRVKFSPDELVVQGAFTVRYLLEKSRIITAAEGERVYHSFYLALRAPDAATAYHFTKPAAEYTSVASGRCLDNSEFNTAAEHGEVCDCMARLGLAPEQIRSVWSAASAVVHQTDLRFVAQGEGSVVDPAVGDAPLAAACRLWGLDAATVQGELLATWLEIGGERTRKVHPVHKAADARDAMSKAVYEALFGMLVERCNESCDVACDGPWIALLDIFGFEDFKVNSFEQLCINLANETLQGHYNEFIFRKDIEQCKAEGIDVVDITCPDNAPCVDLVAGSAGILKLLDDQCSLGNGSDAKFLDGVVDSFNNKHEFFAKKMVSRDTFVVKHYAADVTYTVAGWLDKNRDTLKPAIRELLRGSADPLVASLFPPLAKAAKPATVGGTFKAQLRELMAVIHSTNPHWIRCIKPHPAKKPLMFGGHYTMAQLESSGILGTVKIRKAGYPVRWPHERFCRRYQPIAALPEETTAEAWRGQCGLVLRRAEMDDRRFAQVGLTTVFLKAEAYPLLEKRRQTALRSRALLLQRCGRAMLRRRRCYHMVRACVLQRIGRGCLARAQLFAQYLEANYERLEAERAAREAAARKAESDRKERAALTAAETRARREAAEAEAEAHTMLQELDFLGRRHVAELLRARALAEEKRRAEERQREELRRRFAALLAAAQPLMELEERQRAALGRDADDDLRALHVAEWRRREAMAFRRRRAALMEREAVAREALVASWEPVVDALCAEADAVEGRVATEREILVLEAQLQARRSERQQRAAARDARAESAPRTTIDSLLSTTVCEARTRAGTALGPAQAVLDVSAAHLASSLAATMGGVRAEVRVLFVASVELGQAVFCVRCRVPGTVAEILQGRPAAAPQSFRLVLSTGASVWREPDDVRVRVDAHGVPLDLPDPAVVPAPPRKVAPAKAGGWAQLHSVLDDDW